MNSVFETAKHTFDKRYGRPPQFGVISPGRVNLIGDHTDYSDGFVLPMAIDRHIALIFSTRRDETVRVYSVDYQSETSFSLGRMVKEEFNWSEYVKGVSWALQDAGFRLRGFDAVVAGNIPIGAGLSSSAAMEMAVARALAVSSGLTWDPVLMARLCQKAENKWIGLACGIMDMLICGKGQEGHALLIDCRTLKTNPFPLPKETTIVVLDTTTRRDLVNSTYGERRRQCESAARQLGMAALRDLSPERYETDTGDLEPTIRKRVRHVVFENQRVIQSVKALKAGDARAFGKLMTESHHSLRDDFEVSGQALDKITACALQANGCLGARMTGAGFSGCAVALVHAESCDEFIEAVNRCFSEQSGLMPRLYACHPQAGTRLLEINIFGYPESPS